MHRCKFYLLLILIASLITNFSGCYNKNDENTPSVPEDFVKLKVLYPGIESKRMTDFLHNEFNKRMKNELNMELELNYVPWDQYWSKKDINIASGSQLDWFWDGITNFNKIMANGQAVPLDTILDSYGEDIKKQFPLKNFEATTYKGKIYAIASSYGPSAEKLKSVCVRQDLLEAVGMSEIKNAGDMELFAERTKKKFPDLLGGAYGCIPALSREYSAQPVVFPVDKYLLAVGQYDNKVYSYYETDTFKKVAQKNREWYQKQFYTDDVTIDYNDGNTRFVTGKYIWGEGAITKPFEFEGEIRKNVPNAKLEEYLLSPEKPKFITAPGNEIICISPTSVDPERTMMFLNWIYKSQENYLFTIYGVKDKDYRIDNGRISILSKDNLFYEWMFRNQNFMVFEDSFNDEQIKKFKEWDKDAKYANTFGFTFDSSPVKSEETRLLSIVDQKIIPIATGYVDYTENFPDALEELKAAGIDKYRAEYQRQLDEYMSTSK